MASLTAAFPGAEVIDVTSRAPEPWVRLSPFYPHGGIPVPYCDDVTSESVEGIWQALKVFFGIRCRPRETQDHHDEETEADGASIRPRPRSPHRSLRQ
ncbi:hypothetical protein [Streptomyces sp. F63]|uniref:DUF6939 family protein n=1 Tax=Streptomyces sp. F63 TaxID=2824887 RepID=UPI0035B04DBC